MSEWTAIFSNEISFKDIVVRIWFKRGVVLLLPLLTMTAALAAMLLWNINQKNPIIQYVSLTGIQNEQYPNGATFSPQDLLTPDVLRKLSRKYSIADTIAMRRAITVTYSSPTTSGIILRYKGQLKARKISASEIAQINKDMMEELTVSSRNTLRIGFDYWQLGLSAAQAKELAWQLPLVWSKIYTTRFRVLENSAIDGQAIAEPEKLSTPERIVNADKLVEQMQAGLTIMASDTRLRTLQTPNGISAPDLKQRLDVLSSVYLSAIVSKNLAVNDPLVRYYVNGFALRAGFIDEQIAGINDTIKAIRSILSNGSQGSDGRTGTDAQLSGTTLSGDVFKEIADLTNQASLVGYLTDLFNNKQSLITERATIRRKQNQIAQTGEFPDDFTESAAIKLNSIVTDYNALLLNARKLNRQNAGLMFHHLGSAHSAGSPRSLTMEVIVALMAGLVIGLFFALLIAFFLPSRSPSVEN